MCKKAFPVLVALALLLAVPIQQAMAAEDGDYYDLKAKIIELEKELATMNGLVKDLTYQVQENQALAGIVKELSFQLKKSEGDIHSLGSLQGRIENDVIPQIISIQSTVASLGASLGEKIKALGVRVYDVESSVQQLDARLRAAEDRLRQLDGIEGKVGDLNERVYRIEKALEQGALLTGEAKPDALAQLQDKVGMLSMQVQGLKSQLAAAAPADALQALTDQLSGTQFAVDSLRGRVSELETAQAGLATFDELGEVRSQVDSLQAELQKVKGSANTNFLIGLVGVLAGIGAMGLILLGQ